MSRRLLLVADVSAETVHGGAERMLVHHARALRGAGYELTLLTRQPTPDAPRAIELEGGAIEHRLPFDGDRGLSGLRQLLEGARGWWRRHGAGFDAVVAEQPFVMWALRRAGCTLPRLQVCYSFAFEEYATRHGLEWNRRHALVSAAMRRIEGSLYRGAEARLVLSDYSRRRLREAFAVPPSDVVVAAGGAEVEAGGRPDRAAQRRQLGWTGPVVMTVRNLVPRTGIDLLVQAAAMLRRELPELRWCVVGDGPLRMALEGLCEDLGVADVVEFAGFLPEAEVARRMYAADAFMLPTRALEGFGLVTVEANARGLPVVATPVGANPEVVASLPHNRLAAAISPEALAEAVRVLLAREGDREAVAEELVEAAAGRYAWRHHDAALLAEVARLLDRGEGET